MKAKIKVSLRFILGEKGNERIRNLFIIPITRNIKPNKTVNFYTVLESAAQLNETAIGYRITAQSADSENHFGVKINPVKSNSITFSIDDFIIVVAED